MLFSRSLLIILHIEVCICGRRAWQPTPLLLPGESHGQRRLVGSQRAEHNWSDLAGRQCVYVKPTLPIYRSAGKESACNEGDLGDPWVGKVSWRREWLPTPVFWPGELHGLYSPWGHKESDPTEGLSLFTFTFPFGNQKLVFYICDSISVL